MKRSILTSLFVTVVLLSSVTLLSHASTDKEMVKTDLVDHNDSLAVMVFNLNYIAEPTLEVIPEWTPAVIGKVSIGYKKTVFHPPAINPTYFLFAYSKRL